MVQDRIKMETTEGEVMVEVRRVTARNKSEVTVGDQLIHSRAGGMGWWTQTPSCVGLWLL